MTFPVTVQLALGIAITLVDVVAVVVAISRGQGVERTLAWILAILAFPGLGGVVYLLAADPRVRPLTRRKRLRARAVRDQLARLPGNPPVRLEECAILPLAAAVTSMAPTAGNQVDLLADAPGAFAGIEEALKGARTYIHAEYYIIRRDETGSRFLEILAERARAGVQVRLLYDALGSMGVDARRLRDIRQAGGRVAAFLPLNPLKRRWSVHLRNHRKLIVVDGVVGFTGGMNIGDEYAGRARRKGGENFHDSHLRLEGPVVRDMEQVFREDWSFATGELFHAPAAHPASAAGSAWVSLIPSGPDQEPNASSMIYFAGIGAARERLYLTTPYFIPDEPTLRALQAAAYRGVDVRLLLPRRCDVALVRYAARTYYPALLRSGVRIFEYKPSMLHAKSLVVDGAWGLVGSANLDLRSFRLNFELSAAVVCPSFARGLEARFLADLEASQEVFARSLGSRWGWSRFRDHLARLLSPLL